MKVGSREIVANDFKYYYDCFLKNTKILNSKNQKKYSYVGFDSFYFFLKLKS